MDARVRNNVTVCGTGEQTVVLIHGFGCDQNVWRYLTPRLAATYQLVLIDQVGAGNSLKSAYDSDKYSSLAGYAADILEICRSLELKNIILVGHSVGCMIGVLSAIQEPHLFAKLVLICPSPHYLNEPEYYGGFERDDVHAMLDFMHTDYQGWASNFAPFIMGNPDQPSLGQELVESFCNTNSAIAKEFARVTFLSDNRLDLAKLPTRTLILQCSDDVVAPAEVGDFVYQHVPDATLVTLRATGHCPHLSAPLETLSAIEAFLYQ